MTIQDKATQLKYIKNNLETSIHLTHTLQAIYQNEYLKQSLLLKGGTAVQFYLEKVKRLFFDLDMDFILPMEEKKNFQTYLIENLRQQGYEQVSPKSRFSYSLDSYCFPYYLENGNLNYLKLDINYSSNPHLYPMTRKEVIDKDFELHQTISLVNINELMGMKLASLQESGQIKDLFDLYQILTSNLEVEIEKVKKAYLFYMVLADCHDKIEKTDKINAITKREERKKLYPLIPKQSNPNLDKMKKEVLDYIKECSILTLEQREFIKNFNQGQYHPEYLFTEEALKNAWNNPMANFKIKLKTKNSR